MSLKRLKWLKYLFVNREEAETEQDYWNEKRKRHLANEHSEGIVVGLDVVENSPPSLSVKVNAGRALDSEGSDPEIDSVQELDLSSLVPVSGTTTVFMILSDSETEIEPYFVDEIGEYQNKYVQDGFTLEARDTPPVDPETELARVELETGATAVVDAADPKNPGVNEIDMTHREYTGKEVLKFKDLSDIDEDEADAFNAMNSPSGANPISTIQDANDILQPVKEEVETARGSEADLDARLDVMLNEDGSFKGITEIQPTAPLTGGGVAGVIGLDIDEATPAAKGAMSAADKTNLDETVDKFDPTTGHKHTGTGTDAPQLEAGDVLFDPTPSIAADNVQDAIVDVDSRTGIFQSGVKMIFCLATAPGGWTQDTSVDDKVLRVVSGVGGGTGGSWDHATGLGMNNQGSHSHTITSGGTHDHSGHVPTDVVYHKGQGTYPGTSWAFSNHGHHSIVVGAAGSHNHSTYSNGGHTHTMSSDGSWRPSYVDIIIAVKD